MLTVTSDWDALPWGFRRAVASSFALQGRTVRTGTVTDELGEGAAGQELGRELARAWCLLLLLPFRMARTYMLSVFLFLLFFLLIQRCFCYYCCCFCHIHCFPRSCPRSGWAKS